MKIKTILSEDSIPENYYNIAADLAEPLSPVLHPGTKEPVGPDAVSYTHLTLPTILLV